MQVYTFPAGMYTVFPSCPFIRLGTAHNFGRCFELVCFITKNPNHQQLALFYTFEMQQATPVSNIPYAEAIKSVKNALRLYKEEKTFSMYKTILNCSASQVLQRLLEQYSTYQLRKKSALKIESVWEHKYTCPYDPICIKRLLREFYELQGDLVSHLQHRKTNAYESSTTSLQ